MKKILTISVALAVALGISGCFQNPLETAVEQVTEQAVEQALEDAGVDVDLGLDGNGVSLPDGWPAEVPVPEGTIFSSTTIDESRTILVNVASQEVAVAGLEAIKSQGFTVIYEQDVEGMISAGLEGNGLTVLYMIIPDAESTTVSIMAGPSGQ